MGIAPGTSWPFFDQIDWMVLAIIPALYYVDGPLQALMLPIILAFTVLGALHILVHYAGYLVGVNERLA